MFPGRVGNAAISALVGIKDCGFTLGRTKNGEAIEGDPIQGLYLKDMMVEGDLITIRFRGGRPRLNQIVIYKDSIPESTEDGFMIAGIDEEGNPIDIYFILA